MSERARVASRRERQLEMLVVYTPKDQIFISHISDSEVRELRGFDPTHSPPPPAGLA